jgi:predicted transposase/invertase (TIGR01784 family)
MADHVQGMLPDLLPGKMGDEILRKAVSYAKGDAAMQVSIYDTKVRFSEEREKDLIAQGIEQGIEQGIMQEKIRTILVMYSKGQSLEMIAECSDLSIEEVERIIKENS